MLKQALMLFACLSLTPVLDAQLVDQVERGIGGDVAGWNALSFTCWELDEVISDQPGQFSEGLDLCASTVTQVSDVSNEFSGALTAATELQTAFANNQDAWVYAWYEVTFTLTAATEFAFALDAAIDFTGIPPNACRSAHVSLTITETLSSTIFHALDTTIEGAVTDATSLVLSAGTYQLTASIDASSSVSGISCGGTAASSLNFSLSPLGPAETFRRGDANVDGSHDIADAVFSLNALFVGGSPQPSCHDSADTNDDGVLDIADVIDSLNSLFVPAAPGPALPGPDTCGSDPTSDTLDCSNGCP